MVWSISFKEHTTRDEIYHIVDDLNTLSWSTRAVPWED